MNNINRTVILVLVLISLHIAACTGIDSSSLNQPIPGQIEVAKTEIPSLTSTTQATPRIGIMETIASPTQTQAAVPVAEIDHLDQGTYLVYTRPGDGEYELNFVRTDGSRRMSRIFPGDNPYSSATTDGISPAGNYYAYYTGTAGDWAIVRQDGEYDLKLNIISFEGGSPITIQLLSDEYPNNFHQSINNFRDQIGSEFEWATDGEVVLTLYNAFLEGIGSHEWSPDGRYLAFAGQMDGLSSDLYVFDSFDKSVRRLSSGPEHIQRISWAPDGEHIMHASSYWTGMEQAFTNHSVNVDGSGVVTFPPDEGEFCCWLNESQYIAHKSANGIGSYDLKLFDIHDGIIDVIWPHPFLYFSFHPKYNQFLITMIESLSMDMDPGIFLVDPKSKVVERIETGHYSLIKPLINEDYLYVVGQSDVGLYLLTNEYEFEEITSMYRQVQVSPDMQHLALFGAWRDAGLDIFTLADKSLSPVFGDNVIWARWTPDQSGIFFLSNVTLYYYDILSGFTIEIDEANENQYPKWGGFKFIRVE